ncbi:hypothetical protein JOB18_040563 [Solea senegalensis]|uniref:ALMS motif domain-containing protein n=1 Tax=Solea senegalensis TaxID=28829 RepID=A0AAV6S5I7_SOLSE|nr:uncharacterized protein LOC122781427 isoform X2 [Solea senegalensis]KAG7512814.1 hypothetical protein JOB18_040563 [Solea senegalensis]
MTASALRCGPETGKRSGHFPPPRTSSASIGSRSTCDGIHFPKPATNFSRGRDSFTSMSTMRVSNSKRHAHEQNSTGDSPNELRQASTPPDGLLVRDPGRRELVEHRCSNTEVGLKRDELGGPLMNLSSQPLYRTCIHCKVPLRSTSCVVFIDKSLSISLVDPEGERAGENALYRSTLSVRLGVADTKAAKTNGRHRTTMSCSDKRQERAMGRCRGRKVEQTARTNGSNKTCNLDARQHSSSLELLSFRGPDLSNTKAGRQKGNADEAASSSRSNFRRRQHIFNIGPDSRTWSKKTDSAGEPECPTEAQKVSVSDETCCSPSQLKTSSPHSTDETLSLREALELFRPDFITRSQGRVRRLEQRARRRRALQGSNPDLLQGLREDPGKPRRNCTTPHPLSDNLFKPRERSISGREMQLRSRRIYNKLPEVTKKKEEEKKKTESQTNRLRAEVFKKKLLDQILQR